MESHELEINGFKKKLELLKKYREATHTLKKQRNSLTNKIASMEKRTDELMDSDIDMGQLKMFDDIDIYLNPVDEKKEQ